MRATVPPRAASTLQVAAHIAGSVAIPIGIYAELSGVLVNRALVLQGYFATLKVVQACAFMSRWRSFCQANSGCART